MRYPIETPHSRYNDKYQFATYYTGSGSVACLHLSKEEVIERMTEKLGCGELIDDGTNLYWETKEPAQALQDIGL